MLADTGHLDVAYELLLQDTPPSWLTMVDARRDHRLGGLGRASTTTATPHASLNHYSKGAVISFLHAYVAGIQLLDEHPAYRALPRSRRTGRRPHLGRGRARLAVRAHRVVVARRAGRFRLTTTVPPGTTAEVLLPDGTRHEQSPGTATHECVWP